MRCSHLITALLAAAGTAASAHGQVDATYTGAATGDYNVDTNWDVGVVPLNGGTNYNVIIPASKHVDLDTSGVVSSLSVAAGGQLDLTSPVVYDVLGVSTISGTIRTNGTTSLFELNSPSDNIDGATFLAINGSMLTVAATSYASVGSGGGHFIRATGAGAMVDLSGLTSLSVDPNISNFVNDHWTIRAETGGTIDLSSLATIQGPVSDTGGDRLEFEVANASIIDVTGATSLDGPIRLQVTGGGMLLFSSVVPTDPREIICRDSTLTLDGLASLEGVYLELGGAYVFAAAPQSMIDDAEIFVREGASYVSPATSYTTIGNGGFVGFKAEDPGTTLDLSALTTLTVDPNSSNFLGEDFEVFANKDATIDLSGLATVNGPVSDTDRDMIEFRAFDGGFVDLSNVSTLQGPSGFDCRDGGTVTLSSIHPDDLRRLVVRDGTLNMTGLTEAEGVYIELGGSFTLNTPPLTQIDDAQIWVREGAGYTSPATSYTATGTSGIVGIQASDAGTNLDLTNISTISIEPNTNTFLGERYTIQATSGAMLDFSGLATVNGPTADIDKDRIEFKSTGSGTVLDLSGVTSLLGPSRFDVRDGGTITLSSIKPDDLRELLVHAGTMNLPGLTDVEDVYIELHGAYTLNTPPLVSIDGARFHLDDGASYVSPATSYNAVGTGEVTGFRADGASFLDLSAMTSIDVDPNINTFLKEEFTFMATEGSTIDLSGLATIVSSAADTETDSIEFQVEDLGSVIDATGVSSVSGPLSVTVRDDGVLNFSGSIVSNAGPKIVKDGGRLNIGGNFLFGGKGETDIDFTDGIINFVGDGSAVQTFEVAGEDVGVPVGTLTNNVVVGELIVGDGVNAVTVELCDGQDNDNRGAGPSAEALYVSGIGGGDGLTINAGCTLVLEDLETYVFDSGAWVHVNSLFGGNDCIAWGGGQICVSGCRADFDQNGLLNTADFLAFLNTFTAGSFDADFNCDNIINTSDFLAYLNAFVAGC